MDGQRFDRIVKSLGTGASRRRVLGGAGASALAALALRGGGAAAAPQCRTNADCAGQLPGCEGPCGVPVCERGNAGFGGGGNVCRCASPCEGTSRPNCEVFRGQARCRR